MRDLRSIEVGRRFHCDYLVPVFEILAPFLWCRRTGLYANALDEFGDFGNTGAVDFTPENHMTKSASIALTLQR